ncbi:hybrid sensor histidine kinase/response regulator [Sinorhizobium medicae]|uniref:hybrid sensor histidine kinase/response regulator n=1 Tax=Sinorhizobium medicae TaxID=110321 RepID=UPI000FD810F7|nr:response regulator [Sinorhizobium medicae]RVJ84681.1 hybrid sensor histidine kinase/response regulator [Sinorhizobium medicae]
MITPEELDPGLLSMFTQEVRERASEMETAVLAIEESGDADRKRHLQEQLLRVAHSLKGAAGLLQVRGVETICHWMEEILSIAAKGRFVLAKPRLDLLLSAADAIRHAADLLESGAIPSPNHGEEVVEKLKSVVAAGVDDNMQKPQQHSSPADPEIAIRVTDTDGSMRVSAARLDALLYRSGELLSFNAIMRRHAEQASSLRDAARKLRGSGSDAAAQAAMVESGLRQLAALLRQDVRRMQSAAAALDEEVRYARTQPFDEACKGLGRIVRDVAAASGKRAELEIRGGEIEVDRSVLSALQDSLRHLVRNAVAHGIQTPEERRAAGRPEEGRIRVSAAMRGNRIEIRVEDDGRGLNLALLGAAAGGKTESTQGETELLRRVFEPGVSTSATVTSLSGRGIGLDIVKSNVEKLRGAVDVSQVPTGGAAFTLTLPLTLATLRVLEVIAGGHVFTIDAASVERVIRVNREDMALLEGRHSVSTSTGPIPVLDLSFWLRLQPNRGEPRRTVPAAVVASSSGPTAVLVDEIAGEQELLLRSLGPRLANVRRYSGGMVLPDGRIALLLNVAALAEAAAKPQPRNDIAGRSATAVRRKVLVVDDSKYVRTLVKLILEGAGYEVTMASDGTEALEQLRECGADVVVADVDMPSMDGFELTRAIRQSDHLTRTPVVLVTGRESVEDKVKGLRAGANAYLRKDQFDAHDFLETMRQVV